MNTKRGFFRLWIVMSVCWIAGSGWVLRDDLAVTSGWAMSQKPAFDCPQPSAAELARPLSEWTDSLLHCQIAEVQGMIWAKRFDAAKIVFLPSLGLLVFGCLTAWAISGFTPQSK
ncbi:MAG TPA: hypothetical protein VIY51_00340 [Xanthobacteraceae bacterium]